MKRLNLILYIFIGVCVVKIGLSFFGSYLLGDIISVHDKYVQIESEVEGYKHFGDSLAGNEKFRKRLLDTISNVDDLRVAKENIGREIERKINEFDKLYPNREAMLTTYKVVDGLKNLLNILFVCLGIPLLIHLIRTR